MNRTYLLWFLVVVALAQAHADPPPSSETGADRQSYGLINTQLDFTAWDIREEAQELESPQGVEGKPERISHVQLGLAAMVLLIGGLVVRLGRSAPTN